MTESHSASTHGDDHGAGLVKTYLIIFGALSVFTAVSFIVYLALKASSPTASFIIIFAVAVCKALLVAAYFMHLIWDWKKVYMLIIPALVLGPMMMMVLLPDIVLSKLPLVPEPPMGAPTDVHK